MKFNISLADGKIDCMLSEKQIILMEFLSSNKWYYFFYGNTSLKVLINTLFIVKDMPPHWRL